MQLRKIRVPRDALERMPEAERAFLLLAGHMLNEINSLHKVFAWCLFSRGQQSAIESVADGVQAQIYARLLCGKLVEAWEALRKAFFGAKVAHRIEPLLHPLAQGALKELKAYFGKSNLLHRVRHSFAFHYDADEFEGHWRAVAATENLEIILGGTVGNNLNLASELVVNLAVLKSADQRDEPRALQMFLGEVQSAAQNFTDFLEGVILVLLGSALPGSLITHSTAESIEPRLRFEDVTLPYFYEHGLGDA